MERRVLALLRDLAVRGHGYERWGVRGWAGREDLAESRERVGDGGGRGLLYRVTEAGRAAVVMDWREDA